MDESEEKKEMDHIDELVKALGQLNPALDLAAYKYPPSDLIGSPGFRQFIAQQLPAEAPTRLSLYLGSGQYAFFQELDLTSNVLVAGAIGSGKTQFVYNQLAIWLLRKHPAELKFILCGSKPTDYFPFRKLERHFLSTAEGGDPIISPDRFERTIKALLRECMERLDLFGLAGVRNHRNYNSKFIRRQITDPERHRYLPEIVLIIDDLFNFLTDAVNTELCTLMQMNTGTGIYILALTSQIASPKITKQLRSNFTFHAAFKLMSQAESKMILDRAGAEKLNMPGELFFLYNGRPAKADQFMTDFADLENLLDFIGNQQGYPGALLLPGDPDERPITFDPAARDPFFEESARLVVMHQQGSTSLIQRKLKLGYNRAGRIIDQLEAAKIIGPFEGSKAREVLFHDEYSLERYLAALDPSLPKANQAAEPKTEIPKPEIPRAEP
jgi:S-DNA-T family DNA segregation ATPase FtsK/SpoIIIE